MAIDRLRRRLARVAGIGALLLMAAPVGAATNCNSSVSIVLGGAVGSVTQLTADYEQTSIGSSACLVVSGNNRTLDLNGHSITRAIDGNYSAVAGIDCVDTGITVIDSAHTGKVVGTFYRGLRNCENVDGIHVGKVSTGFVEVGPVIGIENTSAIKAHNIVNNVITNGDAVGIQAYLFDSTSLVDNNYIEAIYGFSVNGTASGNGPYVRYNVVKANQCMSSWGNLRVSKNLCFDRPDPDTWTTCFQSSSGSRVLSDNICDCPTQCTVTPAFTFPWF